MEFANENAYFAQDRINLKNTKSPFASSKKSNKKALSDVKNTIHQKNIKAGSSNSDSPHPKVDCTFFDNTSKDLKSPRQRKKSTFQSKEVILNKMDDEFFICTPCLSHTQDDDFSDILPENIRLSKDTIDIFATRWSNAPALIELDMPVSPVPILEDILNEISFNSPCNTSIESATFLDMLNQSCDTIMVPDISSVELI